MPLIRTCRWQKTRRGIQTRHTPVFNPFDDINFTIMSPCRSMGAVEKSRHNLSAIHIRPLGKVAGIGLLSNKFHQGISFIDNGDASMKFAENAEPVPKIKAVWRIQKVSSPSSKEFSTPIKLLNPVIAAIGNEEGRIFAGTGINRQTMRAIKHSCPLGSGDGKFIAPLRIIGVDKVGAVSIGQPKADRLAVFRFLSHPGWTEGFLAINRMVWLLKTLKNLPREVHQLGNSEKLIGQPEQLSAIPLNTGQPVRSGISAPLFQQFPGRRVDENGWQCLMKNHNATVLENCDPVSALVSDATVRHGKICPLLAPKPAPVKHDKEGADCEMDFSSFFDA